MKDDLIDYQKRRINQMSSVSDLIINITMHLGVSFRLLSSFLLIRNWFYHSIIIIIVLSFTYHLQINSNYLQIRSHSHSRHSRIILVSFHIHSIHTFNSIFIIWFQMSNCDSEWFYTHRFFFIIRFFILHFFMIVLIQWTWIHNSNPFVWYKRWIQRLIFVLILLSSLSLSILF